MKGFLLGLLALGASVTFGAPVAELEHRAQQRGRVTVTKTVYVTSCPPGPTPPPSGGAFINPVGKAFNLGGGQTVTVTAPHQTVTSIKGAGPTQTAYIFDASQFLDQSQNTNGTSMIAGLCQRSHN
jgi:hypothetical protein